jgi:transcriptional regulator with XRE-family HTH domain
MKSIHTREQAAFIERLKKARNDAGLTQIQAAKRLKRGQPYISKVERGELRVGVVELNQFAKLYGKSVEYFLK